MTLAPPIDKLTQQDFLDLLDRLLPLEYLASIKDPGPGFELLQAFAAQAARLSFAVERLGIDSFIDIASIGAKATGEVELFRAGANTVDTPIEGQSGQAANLVTGAPAGQVRVTGLTNMSTTSVGRFLIIQGSGDVTNDGTFEIATFIDATSVDVINASPGTIPDTNNGTITWEEITRTVTVKAGTVVTTSKGGQDFATLDDVTFLPPDVGPFTVNIEAVAEGYAWNVTGQRTALDGTLLEGEIDTIKILSEDPPLGDITIEVLQINDTSGGVDAALAALGRNRGITQGPDENVDAFRSRIRSLPDTISPDAFQRTVENLLRPIKADFEIIETFEITYQTAYDGPSSVIPGSLYNPNLFTYDDPDIDGIPFENRWMDESDFRGGVIVVVENVQPLRDTSMVYDDLEPDIPSLTSSVTGGARAVSAYDVPQSVVSDFGAIRGGYDGSDLQKRSLYRGLFETLQRIKPGGVSVAVELRGE